MASSPARVCLDMLGCQTANSRHRGIGNYSTGLALALARLGDDAKTFIVAQRDPASVAEIVQSFAGVVPPHRVKTIDLLSPASRQPGCAAMQAATLARAYARLNPDVLHVSSLFEPEIAFPHPSLCAGRIKSVTVFDLIPYVFRERYLSEPLVLRWYLSKLGELKNYDLLFAISESSRRDTLAFTGVAPERVVTIMGACGPAFTPHRHTDDEVATLHARLGLARPFLLFTGGIDWRKNIEGAIHAYARLPAATRARHCFAIVCRIMPEARRHLEAVVAQNGLHPGEVVFTGFVSEADLLRLYRTCRAFVFPSLYEGFGLPPLEAISCGAPTIVAGNSSLTEVVTRPDAWFNAGSADEMAAKINAVLTDDAFRRSLIETGLKRAADFTWERSARLVRNAWREALAARADAAKARVSFPVRQRLPRMAYVSPLPPERSGIADFSLELLRELALHYEIELFTTAASVDEPWLLANHAVHPAAKLDERGDEFDVILYQAGNSEFHAHMIDLMSRWPGVVELHDFYLSGMFGWIGTETLQHALLSTHGPSALAEPLDGYGRFNAIMRHAANRHVFEHATGIIVHSPFAARLIDRQYPEGVPAPVEVIPLLRHAAELDRPSSSRAEARARLGIAADEFVICSFGHMGHTKRPDILASAYEAFAKRRADIPSRLAFVGNGETDAGLAMRDRIAASPQRSAISITGYVDRDAYRDWLDAGDVAVQLRADSRGETSGAVLDCMARGLPLVLNHYAEFQDYPPEIAAFIPEIPEAEPLAAALARLADSPDERKRLRHAAHAHVSRRHQPRLLARRYFDTIQRFMAEDWGRNHRRFIGTALKAGATAEALTPWLKSLARSEVVPRPPRTYLDLGDLSPTRCQWVQTMLARLLAAGTDAWPVYHKTDGTTLHACHRSAAEPTGFVRMATAIHLQHGDVAWLQAHAREPALLTSLQEAGVTVEWQHG